MLTKEQALAIADSITAPVDAERSRQIERRARRFEWFYPMLKAVPVSERPALLQQARRHASRTWSFILVVVLVVLAISWPFIALSVTGVWPSFKLKAPFPQLAILGVLAWHHLMVRRSLKAAVTNHTASGA